MVLFDQFEAIKNLIFNPSPQSPPVNYRRINTYICSSQNIDDKNYYNNIIKVIKNSKIYPTNLRITIHRRSELTDWLLYVPNCELFLYMENIRQCTIYEWKCWWGFQLVVFQVLQWQKPVLTAHFHSHALSIIRPLLDRVNYILNVLLWQYFIVPSTITISKWESCRWLVSDSFKNFWFFISYV
jgi:hypothetical protein